MKSNQLQTLIELITGLTDQGIILETIGEASPVALLWPLLSTKYEFVWLEDHVLAFSKAKK